MAELNQVWAKSYQAGSPYDGDIWQGLDYGAAMRAGYALSDDNWVMCIKFVLPSMAKKLTFSFCNDSGGYSLTQHLRWKLLSEEDETLRNATSAIPGDGTFDVNPGTGVRSDLKISKVLSPGTYYLYIWTNDSSKNTNAMKVKWKDNTSGNGFALLCEELTAFGQIKTADGVKLYHAHIKTEGGPVMHAPYIKTADGWIPLGG